MPDHFSEAEALARVRRLSRQTLATLVEAEAIVPQPSEAGPVFTRVDIARLELLCDITEGYDLDEDALCLVMTLVERLHATRADLHALARALAHEPDEIRARVVRRLRPLAG